MSDRQFEIDFATTDKDAVELHRFLCVIAQPVLMAPIDAQDSMDEVFRVMNEGAAITAKINGEIVGSLGIIGVSWWYNHKFSFLTDRWLFAYPALWHRGLGARMLAEAGIISKNSDIPVVINGHLKRRSNGLHFTKPFVIRPSEVDEMDWDRAAKKVSIH